MQAIKIPNSNHRLKLWAQQFKHSFKKIAVTIKYVTTCQVTVYSAIIPWKMFLKLCLFFRLSILLEITQNLIRSVLLFREKHDIMAAKTTIDPVFFFSYGINSSNSKFPQNLNECRVFGCPSKCWLVCISFFNQSFQLPGVSRKDYRNDRGSLCSSLFEVF